MSLGHQIRSQFGAFEAHAHLVYLDSAATTLKPRAVADAVGEFLRSDCANVHRGVYALAAQATERFEEARHRLARALGLSAPERLFFTRGATSALNLAARGLEHLVQPNDVILTTIFEHHSNFVPWQMLARRCHASFQVLDADPNAVFPLEAWYEKIRALRPRIFALTAQSNALGTVLPVTELARVAHEVGSIVVVDGTQLIAHGPVAVETLGADLFAASGHKMYGPTGAGFLAAQPHMLEQLQPVEYGGEMVAEVTIATSSWGEPPARFEAGTPPIAEVVGLGAAVAWIERECGFQALRDHEQKTLRFFWDGLASIEGVTLFGVPPTLGEHRGSISFAVSGVHPHDLASIADSEGVALRAGHHCAQPLVNRLGLSATARVSFGVYSDERDFEPLVRSIKAARAIFDR